MRCSRVSICTRLHGLSQKSAFRSFSRTIRLLRHSNFKKLDERRNCDRLRALGLGFKQAFFVEEELGKWHLRCGRLDWRGSRRRQRRLVPPPASPHTRPDLSRPGISAIASGWSVPARHAGDCDCDSDQLVAVACHQVHSITSSCPAMRRLIQSAPVRNWAQRG